MRVTGEGPGSGDELTRLTGAAASASRPAAAWAKARQHWRWGREQGFRRLVEEDNLDPVARVRTAAAKAAWRRREGVEPGTAQPVFLVGLQRSGTNMLVRGLEAAPEIEVHNENDRRLFDRYSLRPLPVLDRVVARSRHRLVLVKPLCDSHRTAELLDRYPGRARAVWAYRSVDDRARSAMAKFGAHNLEVVRELADGRGGDRWQLQGLSEENRAFVRSLDTVTMSAVTASALFWWLRNSLVLDLGLADRPDVTLLSYDAVVAEPEPPVRRLCAFLGLDYRPELVAHIAPRRPREQPPLPIDPRVREVCTDLTTRLDRVAATLRA